MTTQEDAGPDAHAEPPVSPGAGADSGEPTGASERHRRFLVAVAAMVVVVVAALAVGTVVAVRHVHDASVASRDQAAVDTARDVVTRLSSLGGQGPDLGGQIDALLASSTGPFRAQLANAAGLLGRLADKAQFRSQGSVPAAGLEGSDGQLATVLVVSQSQVSNVAAPQGNLRRYRLAVTLQWDGTRWLAQTVDQVA